MNDMKHLLLLVAYNRKFHCKRQMRDVRITINFVVTQLWNTDPAAERAIMVVNRVAV
jgi:hypothetical protein